MNTRLTNTKHVSLNESIAYVNSPQRELDEATEYAHALEDILLALCEELDIDPETLVESAEGVLKSTAASRLSRRIRHGIRKAGDKIHRAVTGTDTARFQRRYVAGAKRADERMRAHAAKTLVYNTARKKKRLHPHLAGVDHPPGHRMGRKGGSSMHRPPTGRYGD